MTFTFARAMPGIFISICIYVLIANCQPRSMQNPSHSPPAGSITNSQPVPAAHRMSEYVPLLRGKRVGIVVNHSSTIGSVHLLDTLLSVGVQVQAVFAPEHGFRGTTNAGAHVHNEIDPQTGLPIFSLYGKQKKPSAEQLKNLDILVFDIQDVGVRFYTYISTLHYIMESCAEQRVPLMVLDRPNPNGHYTAGPVRSAEWKSFVGMHPIPIVHGLTVGELAYMIQGEGWLQDKKQCTLQVISCEHYTHRSSYQLPIAPSPNLPNMRSIYLYPSLCLFEGTEVSVGRGTDFPFQQYGHPQAVVGSHLFTPMPNAGAAHPKWQGLNCTGYSLQAIPLDSLRQQGFTLEYVYAFYQAFPHQNAFFLQNNFFEKLAGTTELRRQIQDGISIAEIEQSWQPELNAYRIMRKKYLLYPD